MRCSIYECAHRPLKADFSVQFPVNRSIKFDYSALSICQSSTYHRMLRPLGLVKDVNQHGLLISWIFMADLPGLNLNRRNSIALSCTCEYRKQSLAKVTGRIRPLCGDEVLGTFSPLKYCLGTLGLHLTPPCAWCKLNKGSVNICCFSLRRSFHLFYF